VAPPDESPTASMRALGPVDETQAIVFAIDGRIDRADAAKLGEWVRETLEANSGADLLVCDVGAVAPDAGAIDALCRMRLAARRRGCQLRLRDPSAELLELLDLMGLSDVMPPREGSGRQAKRQTEQREHPRRV